MRPATWSIAGNTPCIRKQASRALGRSSIRLLLYFAAYAPGSEARRKHLRDEEEFKQLPASSGRDHCNLKALSIIKPLGADNEHPGYASEWTGNNHLGKLQNR